MRMQFYARAVLLMPEPQVILFRYRLCACGDVCCCRPGTRVTLDPRIFRHLLRLELAASAIFDEKQTVRELSRITGWRAFRSAHRLLVLVIAHVRS